MAELKKARSDITKQLKLNVSVPRCKKEMKRSKTDSESTKIQESIDKIRYEGRGVAPERPVKPALKEGETSPEYEKAKEVFDAATKVYNSFKSDEYSRLKALFADWKCINNAVNIPVAQANQSNTYRGQYEKLLAKIKLIKSPEAQPEQLRKYDFRTEEGKLVYREILKVMQEKNKGLEHFVKRFGLRKGGVRLTKDANVAVASALEFLITDIIKALIKSSDKITIQTHTLAKCEHSVGPLVHNLQPVQTIVSREQRRNEYNAKCEEEYRIICDFVKKSGGKKPERTAMSFDDMEVKRGYASKHAGTYHWKGLDNGSSYSEFKSYTRAIFKSLREKKDKSGKQRLSADTSFLLAEIARCFVVRVVNAGHAMMKYSSTKTISADLVLSCLALFQSDYRPGESSTIEGLDEFVGQKLSAFSEIEKARKDLKKIQEDPFAATPVAPASIFPAPPPTAATVAAPAPVAESTKRATRTRDPK